MTNNRQRREDEENPRAQRRIQLFLASSAAPNSSGAGVEVLRYIQEIITRCDYITRPITIIKQKNETNG